MCTVCGATSQDASKWFDCENGFQCPKCSPTCDACAKTLEGRYYDADGICSDCRGVFCKKCFTKPCPTCANSGMKSDELTRDIEAPSKTKQNKPSKHKLNILGRP